MQLHSGAYDEFMAAWDKAKTKRGGVPVFGKRLSHAVARSLLDRAVGLVESEYSMVELPALIRSLGLTREAYFRVYAEIRDDKTAPPRDRMAAATTIQTEIFNYLRAYGGGSNPLAAQRDSDVKNTLTGILVNVNAPINPALGTTAPSVSVRQLPGGVTDVSSEDTEGTDVPG